MENLILHTEIFIHFYEVNIPIIPVDYKFKYIQNEISSNIEAQKIFIDNSNREFIISYFTEISSKKINF